MKTSLSEVMYSASKGDMIDAIIEQIGKKIKTINRVVRTNWFSGALKSRFNTRLGIKEGWEGLGKMAEDLGIIDPTPAAPVAPTPELDAAIAALEATLAKIGPDGRSTAPRAKDFVGPTVRAKGWAGGAHRGIVGEAGTEVGITRSALRELSSAGIPGYANGTYFGSQIRNRAGQPQAPGSVGSPQ